VPQVPPPQNKTVLANSLPPAPAAAQQQAADTEGDLSVNCPGCGRTIRFYAHEMPLTIECVKCKACFAVQMPAPPPAPAFAIASAALQPLSRAGADGVKGAASGKKGVATPVRAFIVGSGCLLVLLSFLGCGGGLGVWYYVSSTSPESLIVGKWERANKDGEHFVFDFEKDGTMTATKNGVGGKGKYKFVSKDEVEFELTALLLVRDSFKVSFPEKDRMVTTARSTGAVVEWRRVNPGKPGPVAAQKGDPASKPTENKGEMTLRAFLAQRPENGAIVRVDVQIGDYWNFAYRTCNETHYSLKLRDDRTIEHAWVRKGSPEGKRIYSICKDGNPHAMTLKIALIGPDGDPTPPGADGIAIIQIVNER
jgi:hypothetical protein